MYNLPTAGLCRINKTMQRAEPPSPRTLIYSIYIRNKQEDTLRRVEYREWTSFPRQIADPMIAANQIRQNMLIDHYELDKPWIELTVTFKGESTENPVATPSWWLDFGGGTPHHLSNTLTNEHGTE